MAKDPILNLSTLTEPGPLITIDGAAYHLKAPDGLSLIESHWFVARGKQLEQLAAEDNIVELELCISDVAKAALADVPAEVFERLSPAHRLSVVELFTALLLKNRIQQAGALVRMTRPTGANSFPASRRSMGANQGGGSTARQRRS